MRSGVEKIVKIKRYKISRKSKNRYFYLKIRQYRIILSADTASEVRQMPSQKRR